MVSAVFKEEILIVKQNCQWPIHIKEINEFPQTKNIMNIKIDSVEGINLKDQLQIISDYIGKDKEPRLTKAHCGYKIESCGRRYHVSCKRTSTLWSFKIWWGV